jgi:hypothetical protein
LPIYPYSRRWGYLPAGVIALLLIVVLALIGLDYITLWYPWAPVDIEPVPEGIADHRTPRRLTARPTDGAAGQPESSRWWVALVGLLQ